MIDLQGYGPSLLEGAWVTVQLAVLAQLLAIALGLMTATAKMSRSTPLRWIATLYTTIIRGVPDIVLMLLLFFGGQIGINMVTDWLYDRYDIDVFVNVDEFTAGVITIGFIFGAYMGETFRGAFIGSGCRPDRGRTRLWHEQLEGLQAHSLPADDASRPAGAGQQLDGTAQDHRPGVGDRAGRHGACRQRGRQGDP